MRAVIQDVYGPPDVVRLGELPDPVPAPHQVLVEVRAVSPNGSDRENLAGRPAYSRIAGLRRPRVPVPGSDIAGTVVAISADVTSFAVGDEVFGELRGYRGGLAALVACSPDTLIRKPSALTFVEAATIPQAGCIALRALDGVTPGDHVLVNGAGGAGGAFVVALARHRGAEVTAVDRREKAAYLRRLGAERTVSYEAEDWAAHRDRYDRVVDLVGHRPPWRVHRALRPQGRYLVVGGRTDVLLAMALLGPVVGLAARKHVGVLVVPQSAAALAEVTELVTGGAVVPTIDSVFPLSQAPAAFARLAAGENQGKIVVEL